jgi:CHAT domain-containing protein
VLEERLIGPVVQRLLELGHSRAVLLPSRGLGLLPLPAVSFDRVAFTYTPSARSLSLVLKNARVRAQLGPVLLAVGNPENAGSPLPFARIEVEETAAFFPNDRQRCLYGRNATQSALMQALPGVTHLHFACHGLFDLGHPLDSALGLAADDQLTLRDLFDGALNLSSTRLAVLSACQTGLTDITRVPEEAVGFPAGFLQAGVPAVVSTLWPVTDFSSALLMIKFYGLHLKEGLDPPDALRRAQCWLRDVTNAELSELFDHYSSTAPDRPTTRMPYQAAQAAFRQYALRDDPEAKPFAHPYYWAPFVFSGV